MPRFAPQTSQAGLLQRIADYLGKNAEFVDDHEPEFTSPKETLRALEYALIGGEDYDLFPKVFADWEKIDFDRENVLAEGDPNRGLQTLDNGFTYIGVIAGGDWEHPVFAILYHDGKTFRGYVPKDGNVYDAKAKTAYGSSDAETPDDADFDHAALKADIMSRIKIRA